MFQQRKLVTVIAVGYLILIGKDFFDFFLRFLFCCSFDLLSTQDSV